MSQLQKTIKAVVTRGEKYYVAECVEIIVVTQGKTLDEVVDNLRKAVALHLEGEDLSQFGLDSNPALVVTMELRPLAPPKRALKNPIELPRASARGVLGQQ